MLQNPISFKESNVQNPFKESSVFRKVSNLAKFFRYKEA